MKGVVFTLVGLYRTIHIRYMLALLRAIRSLYLLDCEIRRFYTGCSWVEDTVEEAHFVSSRARRSAFLFVVLLLYYLSAGISCSKIFVFILEAGKTKYFRRTYIVLAYKLS